METRIKYIKTTNNGGFMLFRVKSGCFGRQLRYSPLLKVPRDL